MVRLSISWIIPVVTLLELVVHTQPTVFDNSNSFISNNHVRYVVDDIATIQSDILSEVHSPTLSSLSMKLKLKFEPEMLDFEQKPLGVPHLAKVVLYNIDKNSSIDMTSISGNTVHFHCSFFEDKQIPPLGNTTFNVVFLGREEGAIESNLFIHTTEGHFRYRVRGASVHSPYRLRPLVSIRLPPNVLFSPIVYMHNPHTEPIQIVEVYSSGGDFNLELPSGDTEGSRDMWRIPPFETRPVIRLRFYSRTEQNQTAYVRIKLNNTSSTSSPLLIIPLEVSISNDALLYHSQGSLDFGVGGSLDPPKHIPLVVMQNPTIANQGSGTAGRKPPMPVRIHGITTVDCPEGVVTVERVNGGRDIWGKGGGGPGGVGVLVANLTLDWKAAYDSSTFSGKIKITYKGGKSYTEIPFYLTVVNGGLFYNVSSTKFYVNLKEKFAPKKFTVRNDFQTPLTIINANLSSDASIYFTLSDFKKQVLKSKEERPIFVIKLKDNLKHSCHLKGFITVETNISTVQIPLMCYDGKFKAFLPYKSKDNSLDLGLIGFESKKMFTILLVNDNPVAIKIKEIHNSLISTYFELYGCMRRYDEHLLQNTFENAFACENLTVKPKEVAILRLLIDAKKTESRIWGDISVVTQFEELSIPVHFQIAPGKLDIGPDRLIFDQCFPGKLCSLPLRVHSTFSESMLIHDILPIPPDVRIYAKHSGRIYPKAATVIGNLYLDPKAACQDECYLGLSNSDLETWLSTLALPTTLLPTIPTTPLQFDIDRVNTLHARFRTIPTSWTNLTLRLDTTRVRGHVFHTRMRMEWPRLLQHVTAASIGAGWPEHGILADDNGVGVVSGGGGETESEKGNGTGTVITLPRTQIDSVRFVNLTIRNPSSGPLLVQAVLSEDYSGWEELYEGLPPSFLPIIPNINPSSSTPTSSSVHPFPFFFHFPTNNLMTRQTAFRRHIGQPLLAIHPNTLPLVLAPMENYTLTVGYRALDAVESTGMLLIRSNLTVLEVVVMKASGAVVNFKFGNRKPGSTQPLQFELTEKHLKDCEPNQKRYAPPNLTVKRSFTARNNGEFDISIASFFINDFECEGHGFKVLNCEPFVLPPNATKKINIAFTPDFTLAKITRTLILITTLHTPVNYTLVTTVPYNYLSLCASIITRPPCEIYLYYLFVFTLTLSLVIVIILAILDSDRVLKNALASMTKQCNPQMQHTLDLRLVGAQIRTEFKTSKESSSSGSGSEGSSSSSGSPERQRPVILEQMTRSVITAAESICKKTPVVSNRHENEKGGGAGAFLNEPRKANPQKELKDVGEKPGVVPVIGKAKKKLSKKSEPVESTNTIDSQSKPKSSSHNSQTNDAATSTSTNAKHKLNAKQSSLLHCEQHAQTQAQIQHNHDVSTTTTIQNATISIQTSPISDTATFTYHHNKKSTHKDKDQHKDHNSSKESSPKDTHNYKNKHQSVKKQPPQQQQQQQQQSVFSIKTNSVSVMCPSSSNEEDASSQTESSSSREAEDKTVGKKPASTPEVYYEKTKVERRKSTPKSMKIKEHKMDKENHEKQENTFPNKQHHQKTAKHNNSTTKSNRENHNHRRTSTEKQALAKKLSLDKNAKLNDSSNNHTYNNHSHTNNINSNVRGSPSFNRWDENRASFSDVVARNEATANSSSSTLLVNVQTAAQQHKSAGLGVPQNTPRSTSSSSTSSQQHTTTISKKPSLSSPSSTSVNSPISHPNQAMSKLAVPNASSSTSPITNNKSNHPQQQPISPNPKPILCVEPKQTMPSLGPIGSKKTSSATIGGGNTAENNQWSTTEKAYSINQLNSTLESMLDAATGQGSGSGNAAVKMSGLSSGQLLNEGTSVLNHVTNQAPGFLADALTSYHTSSFLDLGFDSTLTSTQNWIHQQHCGGQRLDMFGGMVGRCDDANNCSDPWISSTSPTPSSTATNTSNTSARNSASPSNSNHSATTTTILPPLHPSQQTINQSTSSSPPITVPISTTGSCSYWEQMNPNSLYTNNPPVVLPNHLVNQGQLGGNAVGSQQALQQQQQQQLMGEMISPTIADRSQQSGYLWGGGNAVWQPWTPPRTPTRTPPGFLPRDDEEDEIRFQQTMQPPQTQLYNPFGNNIWNQQQNNPWNYPQGQQ